MIRPTQWFRGHCGDGTEKFYEPEYKSVTASCGHNRIASLINSHGCGCLHKINSQCPARRWEGFTRLHLLLRSHQLLMDPWGRGHQLSLRVWSLVDETHYSRYPCMSEYMSSTNCISELRGKKKDTKLEGYEANRRFLNEL